MTLQQFHGFPDLPRELQLYIWALHEADNLPHVRHYFRRMVIYSGRLYAAADRRTGRLVDTTTLNAGNTHPGASPSTSPPRSSSYDEQQEDVVDPAALAPSTRIRLPGDTHWRWRGGPGDDDPDDEQQHHYYYYYYYHKGTTKSQEEGVKRRAAARAAPSAARFGALYQTGQSPELRPAPDEHLVWVNFRRDAFCFADARLRGPQHEGGGSFLDYFLEGRDHRSIAFTIPSRRSSDLAARVTTGADGGGLGGGRRWQQRLPISVGPQGVAGAGASAPAAPIPTPTPAPRYCHWFFRVQHLVLIVGDGGVGGGVGGVEGAQPQPPQRLGYLDRRLLKGHPSLRTVTFVAPARRLACGACGVGSSSDPLLADVDQPGDGEAEKGAERVPLQEFLALADAAGGCACGTVAARAEELWALGREVRGLFGGGGGGGGRDMGRAPVVGVEVEVSWPELGRLTEIRGRRRNQAVGQALA